VAFGVLDLIDADRIELSQRPMLQRSFNAPPEGDDVFRRVEDLVPGGANGLRRLFP